MTSMKTSFFLYLMPSDRHDTALVTVAGGRGAPTTNLWPSWVMYLREAEKNQSLYSCWVETPENTLSTFISVVLKLKIIVLISVHQQETRFLRFLLWRNLNRKWQQRIYLKHRSNLAEEMSLYFVLITLMSKINELFQCE